MTVSIITENFVISLCINRVSVWDNDVFTRPHATVRTSTTISCILMNQADTKATTIVFT